MATKVRPKSKSVAKQQRRSVRLRSDLFDLVEEAAIRLGQSVDQYVAATLAQNARQVIQQATVTNLGNRDRDLFLALLDDKDAQPNAAFKAAAKRYRKYLGQD